MHYQERNNLRHCHMSYNILQDVHCSLVLSLIVRSMLLPSCSGYVDWIYPNAETTGMTFNYNDVVYFTWTSNITSPWMKLWCKPSGTGNHSIGKPNPGREPCPGELRTEEEAVD